MWEFKSETEIKKKVKEALEQSINGLEKESTKLDFKLEWYNLKEEKEVFEFVKDITALVNTVGLDAFIIIGYDEKRKVFQDAKITDSNKRATDINDIVNKRVSTFFDLNIHEFDNIEIDGANRVLSIIHIPIFIDKPVVIKGFKNFRQLDKNGNPRIEEQKIFVRKNSSNRPATKYDLDFMYYDRKNILPDYNIAIDLLDVKIKKRLKYELKVRIELFLENLGRRSICVKQLSLYYTPHQYQEKKYSIEGITEVKRFDLGAELIRAKLPLVQIVTNSNNGNHIIIEPSLKSEKEIIDSLSYWNAPSTEWEFLIILSNGKSLYYKIENQDI